MRNLKSLNEIIDSLLMLCHLLRLRERVLRLIASYMVIRLNFEGLAELKLGGLATLEIDCSLGV